MPRNKPKAPRLKTARPLVLAAAVVMLASGAAAQEGADLWVEAGATKSHFNLQAGLSWAHSLGDWHDADDVAQGDKPFDEVRVADTNKTRAEDWEVTPLVKDWVAGRHVNKGFLLRGMNNSGSARFFSREYANAAYRPQLVIQMADGSEVKLVAVADTFLDKSTIKALGRKTLLYVSHKQRTLVRFDLSKLQDEAAISKAVLRLTTTNKQYGAATIGVFRASPGEEAPQDLRDDGIANNYPRDDGIEKDPDVIFAADFEKSSWSEGWSELQKKPETFELADAAPELKFERLSGSALKVAVPKGRHLGLNMSYLFQQEIGSEPEEVYFRYYLRFADDWNPTLDGGKLPGIAGTYNRAGWGGRSSNGKNGWSARGSFGRIVSNSKNPYFGATPVGSYVYSAGGGGKYGDIWTWSKNSLGTFFRNRWYCVEQHVRLNSPDKADGILEVWVDGKKAFERRNLQFRTTPELKIDRVWMNVYHGGTAVSPETMHLFMDNVVIARKYIGPLSDRP